MASITFYNADRDNRIHLVIKGLGKLQRFGYEETDYRMFTPAARTTDN